MRIIKLVLQWICILFTTLILLLSVGQFFKTGTFSGIADGIIYTAFVWGLAFVLNKYGQTIKSGILIAFLCVGAFVLRMVYIDFSGTVPVSDYKTMYDGAVFYANGGNPFYLHSYFHRFPHMTFFTYVCGSIFRCFGENLYLIKVINAVLSCLCVLIVYFIAKKLFGKKAGLTAALIYTFFPPAVTYPSVFTSENFALPFLMLSLYFIICAGKETTNKCVIMNAALSGLCVAAGCLFRGVWHFYITAYVIIILLMFNKKRIISLVPFAATMFIVFQLVSNTLFYRGVTEYKLDNGDVPSSVYILVGFNFETGGMFSAEDQDLYFEAGQNKEVMSEMVNERLKQRISSNVGKIVPLLISKTAKIYADGEFDAFVWSYPDANTLPILYNISLVYYVSMLAVIMFLLMKRKKSMDFMMLFVILLTFEAGLMLMEVQPRYTFACAYVFVILASAIMRKKEERENEKIS